MRGWKDWRLRSRRRQAYKQECLNTTRLERIELPEWEQITKDPLSGLVDIFYSYLDFLHPMEDYYDS